MDIIKMEILKPQPKVNCPYCNKKKPHGHKGCNEANTQRISIGEEIGEER